MMHGEVCGDGGVAVDGKGLRSAALNCLAVYRPTTEVIAAVCGRGEGDKRIRLHLCAIFLISSYRAVCTGRVVQRIEAVDRNFSVGFGVLERISVILGIRSHIRVIGKQNQCQLVACLDRIVGRLEIQSIIIILAVLQFNLVCSRSGVKACTRVRKVHPALCDYLIISCFLLILDYCIILGTTANPVDLSGFLLDERSPAIQRFRRERSVRHVNQHCAHHQRIAAVAVRAHNGNIRVVIIRALKRIHSFLMVNTTRSNCPRILIRSYSSLLSQMLNRSCPYMNLSRANNNGVSIHIHRVNSTCRSRIRVIEEMSIIGIAIIAVNGGFAIVAASKTQGFGISIPIAKSSPTAVRIVLNRNSCHVLSAVVLVIQIMAEPFVQNTVIRLSINQ